MNPVTLLDDATRKAMSLDSNLGAGNFFATALANSPAPGEPILFLERPFTAISGEVYTRLTYLDLDRLQQTYARMYRALGVRPQDPVFVYLDDSVEYLIHYLALVHIGAIGVLTNGNMPPKIALAHARNVGAVGIFTDDAHEAAFTENAGEFRFLVKTATAPVVPASVNVKPFVHTSDDPIMIAHSSGTTGIPKAVLLQHTAFFYGVRYRLGVPRIPGGETILSSLPHSHNCAIAYIMLALLSGTPVYVTSDHRGESVLKRIGEFKPKMVVSFPQTYVEMTECNLADFDLSSVNLWFNGGDAAHESHIRALIAHGHRVKDGVRKEGSVFIDGMGSSEMGFSLFRNVHTPETNKYNRCIGQPLEWVDAQILSEDGEKLGPNQIGRLAVKAPSVTSGYWNNSLLTYRSRMSGYFLTGDLAYRDEGGWFFHVDRTPDVIHTANGPVYGLKTEEFLLSRFADIADCTVFGVAAAGSAHQIPSVRARLRPGTMLSTRSEHEVLREFNLALAEASLPVLKDLKFSSTPEIPLGTTGKVLKRELRTEGRVS